MNKKGFTLIELLVTIAVLVVIMLIAIPTVVNIINNSKVDSLVSSTKILAKAIQSDSVSTGFLHYKLDSEGTLCRANSSYQCALSSNVKYNGKLVSSSETNILVSHDNNTVISTSGTVCNKDKKMCFNSNTDLLSVTEDQVINSNTSVSSTTNPGSTTSGIVTTTDNHGAVFPLIGDISAEGSNVSYSFGSNGVITVSGTGAIISADFEGNNYKQVAVKILYQLIENDVDFASINAAKTLMGLEEFTDSEFLLMVTSNILIGIYRSPTTNITDFVDWFYLENGFYPRIFSEISNRENNISDLQTIFSWVFGAENFNMEFDYIKPNSLVIGSGVTEIGDYAFYGLGMTAISLSNTVTKIHNDAFRYNKFKSVTLPSSVAIVEYRAFADNELESIVIHGGTLDLNSDSFCNNPDLVNPTFYENTTNGGSFGDPVNLGGSCK